MVVVQAALWRCWLGYAAAAVGGRGVRALVLADDEAAVRRALAGRLPQPLSVGAAPGEGLWPRLAAQLEDPASDLGLPVDPQLGSPWQLEVWRALRQIPAGTTTSYGELAGWLGRPGAARAVAGACAANPVGVVIPCHRVVGANGALTGYRWGISLKGRLLGRERHRQAAGGAALPAASGVR